MAKANRKHGTMPEDEFDIYLTLLAKTLRLSETQRNAISSELRDHMEQRLEELTADGMPRKQAIEQALEEFGGASALAKGLTKINPERAKIRRHLLQTSFGTIAACAVVTFAIIILSPITKNGQAIQSQVDAQGKAPENHGEDGQASLASPSMVELIEQDSGITHQNTGKIILRGDEASGTVGKDIVLDNLDEFIIQDIWDTVHQSRPYDHWVASGYRVLEFYADADSDKPDITLYINETSATHTSKNGKRFRCPGLPELIRKIRKAYSIAD